MENLYKRFKGLTGFNAQNMADKVGVSRQHIHASMGNYSITYRTSVAAIMSVCIGDKINELEKNIEELKEFRKEVLLDSIINSD